MDNSSLEPSLEKQLKGHKNSITALFFNPNGQQIASGSLDNSVLLWDLRGTMRSYRFQGHSEAVMDVTFSPCGKYMASASRDQTVRLWVPTVTGSTGMFKAHSQTVRSVQFNFDGSKIITASDDKIVKMWSTDKHKFISSYVGHTNWVRCAHISSDDKIIASCSDDKTTRLWTPDSGECIFIYRNQKGHGLCVAWHPSGCYIALGTSQGNVKLYDVRTHSLVQYYSIHSDAITQLAFHPSGSYILTASKDGKMKILDLLEGHPIFTLSGHTGAINAVHFSASGDMFASAGDDKLVFIWKTMFTSLSSDEKENIAENMPKSSSRTSKLTTTSRGRNQGGRYWYQCYHNNKLPLTTFLHLDDAHDESLRLESISEHPPNAHSTQIESRLGLVEPSDMDTSGPDTYDVGSMSHIPRIPPSPSTFTMPSVFNKSARTDINDSDTNMFGIIKLGDNDVCYTSGTIEWVGRKRSYPINSGFKIIPQVDNPSQKRSKINNMTHSESKVHCDCADVLPTVNAVVDHLNALHEAIDLVHMRLHSLEDPNEN